MIDHSYLEQLHSKLGALETRMSLPEVSSDPQKMQECMREYSHKKKLAECARRLLSLQDSKTESEAIAKSLESVAELDVMSRIQMVAQSADAVLLAVYGEKDDIIIPDPERLNLNGSAKNIRPIGLADSKHFPMLEDAAKFNRLLQDFLDVENDLSVLELKEEWRRRTR